MKTKISMFLEFSIGHEAHCCTGTKNERLDLQKILEFSLFAFEAAEIILFNWIIETTVEALFV